MYAKEVDKEQVESENTENHPEPTYKELKEMFGFKNLSVHHINVENVAYFGFFQVVTHTENFTMLNPTTSGVEKKGDSTRCMVANNRINTGMAFADIVRGNQSPKLVARVNPVIPDQQKHVPQKKQVMRLTLA